MILKSALKEKGSKLIKTTIELKDNKIINIRIHGDFFLIPEEKINLIENFFNNKEIKKEKKETFVNELNLLIKNNNIQLLGINAKNIVNAVFKVMEDD